MGMTYFVLSSILAAAIGTGGFFAYQAIFNPSGWTKKDNYGVAVRFKVFLPLYLQNPEKWKLMPDKVMYDNLMTVYFSSGHQWRKYNRWRKRAEKEQMKRQQEERMQEFFDMIFKDYKPKPNPEFTPPPTVKPKADKDKLTNAELDKIRADLLYSQYVPEKIDAMIKQWADSKEWGKNPMELAVQAAIEEHKAGKQNPRCKDCIHMRYTQRINDERFDTVCDRHITKFGLEYVWTEKTACGLFEERRREVRDYGKWAAARDAILHSVQTEQIPTSVHYE